MSVNGQKSDCEKITTLVRFGSRARGDETSTSDQDVLVFATGTDDLVSLSQEVYRLLPQRDLDVHFYSPHLAPALAFEILRDAEVFYEISPGRGALDLAELAMLAEPPPLPLEHFTEVKRMGHEEALRKIERRLASPERGQLASRPG